MADGLRGAESNVQLMMIRMMELVLEILLAVSGYESVVMIWRWVDGMM